ncbi:protein kinase domain-containing protein [Streptacidiphilus anmyonensis]|uniref:protein kinase domain-containing protein n=1 Tax=Streptacidiphilus anmyonensis TaxID=405782 RepID=UPI000694A372|nr:protein kinase [Streptacidiphilus anmyonensis]
MLADRYELQHELGRGGMGTVHRAVDHRLRRLVAVKTLAPELAHDPQCRARFQREAHAVAALNHPVVATIHDVAEDVRDGALVPYLVMEYVDGVTLADVLRRGPLPVGEAVDVAMQVLDALDHSHRQGILHRDIKPANIMTTRSGAVKVLDFGIARALTDTATRLTGTGMAVGTPACLSPEQINGLDVDHRADLYAVGCLLYELLTGRQPFVGDSPFVIMHQHLTAEPAPPSRSRPEVPPALDAVVLTALGKTPADRYRDAASMRAALARSAPAGSEAATVLVTPVAPSIPVTPVARPTLPAAEPPGFGPASVVVPPATDPVPTSPRPWVVRLHPTAEGVLAVLGCALAALCARMRYVEAPHFAAVTLLACLLGALALLWSARLACTVAWGPVAETLAVQSDLRRAYLGFETKPVLLALGLAATAVVCAVRCCSRRGRDGGFAAVGAWLTGTAALWFFLDDQNKTAVFYALLAAAVLGMAALEPARRRGDLPAGRASGSGSEGAPARGFRRPRS